MRRTHLSAVKAGAFALGAVAAVALLRDTASQGQDFEVFWSAAGDLLSGRSVYRLDRVGPSGEPGMVFKYPPWAVPAFVPLSLLPLWLAKWAWGLVELVSLGAVVAWLRREGVSLGSWMVGAALFWGIWAVHALDGQVSLPILAMALWLWRERGVLGTAGMLWALSFKIFPLFAVFGRMNGGERARSWIGAGVIFAILTFPTLWAQPDRSPIALASAWSQAAASGSSMLSAGKVRGRENQGLPALVMRKGNMEEARVDLELIISLGVGVALCLAWRSFGRGLAANRQWAGWLAVGALAQPLAWIHAFALTFPLAVFALEDARRSRRREYRLVALTGLAALTLVSEKTMGGAGLWLELFSIKSLGALLCASACVLIARDAKGVSPV